jgi:phosphate transport system permease protein
LRRRADARRRSFPDPDATAMTAATVPHPPLPRDDDARGRRDARIDRVFRGTLGAAAGFVLLALVGAALSMAWGGREALQTFGWSFFTGQNWDVGAREFGALVPIWGTVFSATIAMVIAVPVSFGIAVFLTEVCPPWLRAWVGGAIELLAGIPSIIYGMWGLFVLAPFLSEHAFPWFDEQLGPLPAIGALFRGPPLGIGMGTAGLVLAVMVIPFIASVMREVFLTVPQRLKESAYALGSTRWEVVWDIVLPYTRSAVIGGIFLGLGRALGETMAVTFVIGNAYSLSPSLLEPGTSIASTIANEFGEALDPLHKSALLALAFVLFLLTFVVLALAKVMLMKLQQRGGR